MSGARTAVEVVATCLFDCGVGCAICGSFHVGNLIIIQAFLNGFLIELSLNKLADGINGLSRYLRSSIFRPAGVKLQHGHRCPIERRSPCRFLLFLNVAHLVVVELHKVTITRSSLHCSLQSFTNNPLGGWY